jgi:pyruvate kinase
MATKRQRKTKIIATLGPASDTFEIISELYENGADVFRLNMSHGSQEDKLQLIEHIRKVEKKFSRHIAIMADMQGPKIRVGIFENGPVKLSEGDEFSLDLDDKLGDKTRVNLPHKEIFEALEDGTAVLINDGKIRLKVLSSTPTSAKCEVVIGGEISDRKGVNIPDVVLPLNALTKKDIDDLKFMLDAGVDWIALSFVQRAEDVKEARKIVGDRANILAKIEKPAALINLEDIIEEADAIMVARGDLGVEAKMEEVPVFQRKIIRLARKAGKPVVVATQMLESMITAPVPTRAEVSDVANAVYERADAIMLSAESAAGKYPRESVKLMDNVAQQVECDPEAHNNVRDERLRPDANDEDAITLAARQTGRTVEAKLVVTFTTSGSTALRAARTRPDSPILALTPSLDTARRLSIVWGIHAATAQDVTSFEQLVWKARRMALKEELVTAGDKIIVTAGIPFGTPGSTNVLHIGQIQGDEMED